MIAARIERLMRETPTCRAALLALHTVNLPDAWIAAGLVRNAVWDERHGFAFSVPEDIDLIYFDPIFRSDRPRRPLGDRDRGEAAGPCPGPALVRAEPGADACAQWPCPLPLLDRRDGALGRDGDRGRRAAWPRRLLGDRRPARSGRPRRPDPASGPRLPAAAGGLPRPPGAEALARSLADAADGGGREGWVTAPGAEWSPWARTVAGRPVET
jgi:hypothetical protein